MRPFGHRRDARSRPGEPIVRIALSGLRPGRTLLLLSCRRIAGLVTICRINESPAGEPIPVARRFVSRHDHGQDACKRQIFASKPVDRYTAGTRSASFKGQRGEDVNVKRAAALVASAIGVLLLAAVVGLGPVASPSSAGTPAKATLTARIYGDSVNVPASTSSSSSSSSSSSTPGYVDDSSGYTSYYGDGSSIYGDGTSSIYGDSSSDIYGDGSSGVQADIYGD